MMDQLMDKLKVYITYLKEHKKIARAAAVVLIMIVAVVFFGHNGEKEEIPIQLPEETKNKMCIRDRYNIDFITYGFVSFNSI